jgi:ribosome-associated heat shock protein Hsp15
VAEAADKLRLDKWLWAARFFKTRAQASEAIGGGHVHLNGERVKPARTVKVGDTLSVRKAGQEWTVVIEALSARRGPASVAQQLYTETEASRTAREQLAEQRRLETAAAPRGQGRPDKKARRQIVRFTQRGR